MSARTSPVFATTLHTACCDHGGGKTKVMETVIGFGESATHDVLYARRHDDNAEYLTMLAKSFDAEKPGRN
jgi:hypothetical protein